MSEFLSALNLPGRIDGIDVSSVQASIDWAKVAAAGFRFAIVKVSEGVGYCDPRALENLRGARAHGLRTMVYPFARPSQEKAREQAARLWECVGDEMPCRLTLDLETKPDGWSPEQIIAYGEEFADELEALGGRPPALYSFESYLISLGKGLINSRLARCPLWIARYRSVTKAWAPGPLDRPFVMMPWKDWTLWQYSGNGGFRVPGVPGDCDRNLFNGDEAAFRRFCGLVDPDAPTVRDVPDPDSTRIVHPTIDFPPRDVKMPGDDS